VTLITGEADVKRAIKSGVIAATAAVIVISSLSASAGRNHYTWVDDRGNPEFSDRPPPPGVEYEVVSTGSSLKRQVGAEEGAVPAENEPSVGNEFEAVDAEKMQVMKKNPEYCQRARDNLQTLDTAARIRVRNDQGEFRYLDEQEKESHRQTARSNIDKHCE
jgi:hypothetical protein